jgi:hypothetical protein
MNVEEVYAIGLAVAKENREEFLRAEIIGPREVYLFYLRGMSDMRTRRLVPSTFEALKKEYL